jgi:hypothetical protein
MHKWKDGWSYRRLVEWMGAWQDRWMLRRMVGWVCEGKEGRKEETVIYLRQ